MEDTELIARAKSLQPTWHRGMYGAPQDMYAAPVVVPLIRELIAALEAAAIRYRRETIEEAAKVAESSTIPLPGKTGTMGSRSQWYAYGVRDAATRIRALLDEKENQ